jgi:hypothetical protein
MHHLTVTAYSNDAVLDEDLVDREALRISAPDRLRRRQESCRARYAVVHTRLRSRRSDGGAADREGAEVEQ